MTTRTAALPAPTGGWNTRDSLDSMPASDAVDLENWIPGPGKVSLRMGYAEHSDSTESTAVETLIEYHSAATQKLIGATGGGIYDFTSSSTSTLGTGFTNAQWQVVNFNGYVHLVNGADAPQNYEGTTLAASGWTGSGLTPANLDGVTVFKNRLFYWDSGTQDFWYAAVNVITGTLTKFPLSRVGQFGGNLMSVAVMNVDAGDGIDDLICFIMSSGETIIYQGGDPGDAADWALVGVFNIGQPINVRGVVQVGGDVVVSTYDDYVSLVKVLKTGYIGGSSKLSGAISAAAISGGSLFGWQSVLFPAGGLVVMNVPKTGGTFEQHVISTQTGAAAKLTGLQANCWATFGNELYFGGDGGKVYKYTGTQDNGAAITGNAVQAWNIHGTPNTKRVAAVRPVLRYGGGVSYEIGVGFDFENIVVSSPSSVSTSLAPWDTSAWDVTSWAYDDSTSTDWEIEGGVGQSIAPNLKVSANAAVSWLRTDFRIEVGRNL